MKRNYKKVLSVFVASVITMFSFSACGNETNTDEPQKEEITVTFMNGETKLGEINGNAGEKLSDYSKYESLEDYEFLGWYETPTFLETSKKDLATVTFEESTTLYGSFKSTKVTQDTRIWYIAGTGKSSVLAASNWASSTDEASKEVCQLKPVPNAANEFELTLDLYAGDQFQIIHDWAWDGQKGFGKFTTIDETQMENGGGLSGNNDTSNVNVIMDGNYTITLITDPDNELQDTLSIVRNGDVTNQ